jgi:hypothetical protein
MTKEDAVAKWIEFGSVRFEAFVRERWPQKMAGQAVIDNAYDIVEGLAGLGLLKLDDDKT